MEQPRRTSPLKPRGRAAPLVIWIAAFAAAQTFVHGFRWWIVVLAVGLPLIGVVAGLVWNVVRDRRAESDHRKHPFWL